jgi:regulator of sirC expression with transglutaminase-like and TPR domain
MADWQRFLELAPNHPQAPAVRAAIQQLRARQRAKAGAGAGK